MSLEIKINNRIAKVEVIEKTPTKLTIKIDDKTYDLEHSTTEPGVFLLYFNKRFHKFLVSENQPNAKNFTVQSTDNQFDISIIDREAKYLLNRNKNKIESEDNIISFPMPGKVVKILVNEGDKIKIGDTLIIISAMKMESEYKAAINGIVKKINTNEGATIEGNQPLIYIEKQ